MNLIRNSILRVFIVLGALFAVLIGGVSAQDTASIRFVHAVPGATTVDVYVNGALAINGLAFGTATGYIEAPAGDHTVTVTATGTQAALWQQSISVAGETATTFVASDPANLQFAAFSDNLGGTTFGATRLLLVHAIAGAPAVDVALAEPVSLNGVLQPAGTVLASGMEYGTSFGSFDVPAQTYAVNVLQSGTETAIAEGVSLPLASGTSYMAIAIGTADNPEILLLSAPTGSVADSGLVRFIHGIVGAPAVDVYVNDTLLVPGLSVDQPSAHIALPVGDHSVTLMAAGTEDALAESEVSVEAGSAQSVVALAGDEAVNVSVFADDISNVNETTAVISVINAIASSTSISIELADGNVIADALEFSATQAPAAISPVVAPATLSVTIDDQTGEIAVPEQAIYGGTYYNVIAVDGDMFNPPRLIFAPTTINQTLASAANADATLATADISPEQPASPETTTDETSTDETTTDTEVSAATPAPVQQQGDPNALSGRIINLDPGVNLQLRQYPNREALSLGLAPAGSSFEVVGREGAPVALVEGEEPPAEAADWVDPVEALGEDEDLEPTETWLRINYPTPDGGTISAWVIAQYVDVRDGRNNRVALRDLETFGGNIPGEAVNTAITPPAPPEDRVTVIVTDLNPGVNLNVRRLPDTVSEVLVRLPNNTVSEFVGLIEPDENGEQNWVFVEYLTPEGGSVTGWASTTYIRYEYNSRTTTIEEITERGYYNEVDPETIGQVRGSVQQATIPTPDPTRDAYVAEVLLDPGANLQFRRLPDAQSESLNRIPSGTRLIVTARTEAGDWLKTDYEGETGWVAAQFVVISYNGQFVDVESVPVEVTPAPETESEDQTESAG